MQTLHVRDIPDQLYNRLRELAQAKQRSLSAQVVLLLDRALEDKDQRKAQTQALADIRRRRFTPPPTAPDSIEMLRADRKR